MNIFDWAMARPKWQQDALYRISKKGALEKDDVDELRQQIEYENDLHTEKTKVNILLKEHLVNEVADHPTTVLKSIGPVKNVDRLAENQNPLEFIKNGITIIFGANGSGKSGYCRIVKKMCRSTHPIILRNNIYKKPPIEIPSVKFSYAVNEKSQEIDYKENDLLPAELKRISVFDSKSASIYVDSDRNIDFLPRPLDILQKLSEVSLSLSSLFDEREKSLLKEIQVPLPSGYNDGTKVSNFIKKILPTTKEVFDEKELKNLGIWNAELEKNLLRLESDLRSSPEKQIELRERVIEALNLFRNELSEKSIEISDLALNKLIEKKDEAAKKRELAKSTATDLFEKDPIKNIGVESWFQMFEYAKKFATEAYLNIDPPAIVNGDKCVLCQQSLDEEARSRIERFDKYVSNCAAQDAELAKKVFVEEAQRLRSLKTRGRIEVENMLSNLLEIDKDRSTLVEEIATSFEKIGTRIEAIKSIIKSGNYEEVSSLPALSEVLENKISHEIVTLKREIESSEKLKDEKKKTATLLEYQNLLDQKKLSTELDTFADRLKKINDLKKNKACKQSCSTASITTEVTKLRKSLLTSSLKENLEKEIKAFDLKHLPINLKPKSDRGKSLVQIELASHHKVGKNSDILSEGELRALSLACFFAELKEIGGCHGIVIDDPVSSLDHSRIDDVAKRIVSESKKHSRQIIIFTHNLAFHHAITHEAQDKGVEVREEWIAKSITDEFGLIDESQKPWIIKRVKQRVSDIKAEMKSLKLEYDHNNQTHRSKITSVYTKMRETWEKTVEEILFADVIRRCSLEISTQKIRSACIEDEDKQRIFQGMSRCSRYSGHDNIVADLPKLEDIENDLNDLDSYSQEITKRKNDLDINSPFKKSARSALEQG